MFMKRSFDQILIREYWSRYKKFGSTPMGSFWLSKKRQERRFKIIIDEIKKLKKTHFVELSDIGCGYGALAKYIKVSEDIRIGKYTGYDVNKDLIGVCKKEINEKWADFKVGSKPDRTTMFAVMSGTYNLAATKNIFNWEKYVEDCLSNCWDRTLAAMIFNVQVSKEARISKENIYYAEKPRILNFCVSSFGPTKLVEHNELPNDATFVVSKV